MNELNSEDKLPVIETMTIQQVYEEMKQLGLHASPPKIRAGISQGKYPFGICINMKTQEFEIYRSQFDQWVAERLTLRPAQWWKKLLSSKEAVQ